MQSRRGALASIGATTLLAGCKIGAGPASLVIGNAAGTLNQTLAEMLRRQGFLRAFGVAPEMIEVADGARILRGIVGGSLTASFMSGFGQVFPANARGAQLRLIGGAINRPVLALFTAKDAIAELQDLRGKTIGIGSLGALIHQLTATLLKNAGLAPDAVNYVTIGTSAEVFRAVRAGTVDAGVGPASLSDNSASLGVKAIAGGNMAEALPDFTYAGAWTSASAITQHRDQLVRMLAAHLKLYQLVQSPAGRQPFLEARAAVLPKATAMEHEAEWRLIDRFKPLATDLVLPAERLNYLQDINITFRVQKQRLPVGSIADMSLAQDAMALANR